MLLRHKSYSLVPTLPIAIALVICCLQGGLAQNNKVDSLQSLLKQAKDTTEIGLLNQLSEALRRKNNAEAISYAEQALGKSEKSKFDKGIVQSLHNIGIAYGFNNEFSKAEEYLQRSAQTAEKLKLWKMVADDYTTMGSLYYVQGNNEKWLEYYLKALKIYEQEGDKKGQASVLYGVGNSLASEKKFDQALQNYFKSIAYFEELNERKELPKVYVNVGKAYEDMSDYPQALAYYEKALTGFAEFKNKGGKATSLKYRAGTYFLLKDYDLALADLDESIRICREVNYQPAIFDNLVLMSKIEQARKQYNAAVEHMQEAVTLAKRIGSKSNLSSAYQLLSELYFAKGDFKNAYEFQGLHKVYYDSTFSAEKSKQIQEMQIRFDTQQKAEEIELLKRDKALNQIYLGVAVIGVLFAFTIGFLVINRQKIKIKADRELSLKENQILEERKSLIEAELLNRKLNEDHLRDQIDFKNKEMTTYALNLIQKNELLDNIKAGIEDIRAAEADQIKLKLQSLLNTVNYSFHLDKDWENFRMHFEQVHQSFFDKLNELFPDLGANDIKLCALIRLNLDTKEMATVLDISPESAKVARHRLRKKLNLQTDQNLSAFLSKL